jgi:hypothetical protein
MAATFCYNAIGVRGAGIAVARRRLLMVNVGGNTQCPVFFTVSSVAPLPPERSALKAARSAPAIVRPALRALR